MRVLKLAFVAAAASLVGAADAEFDVKFSKYAEGEALSDKGASGGEWAKLPSDAVNLPRGKVNVMALDAEDDSQFFDIDAAVSVGCSTYDFRVAFDVAEDLDEIDPSVGVCRFTLAQNGESVAFALAAGGAWHRVAGEGVAPACGTLYDLRLETLATGGGVFASLLVRGEGGYVRLADAEGVKWFALTARQRVSQVEFAGNGGFSDFSGRYEDPVEFDAGRPQVGKALSLKPRAFDGIDFSLTSCSWYGGTPAKAYAAEPLGEGTSYTPAATDCERWLKVVAKSGETVAFEREIFLSTLPVVYLVTADGLTPTQEKEEHKGTMTVQGNREFKGGYGGGMKIKVRGNTTRLLPKKPWKIKLDDKAEMCGIPKSKHWVLLANYNDESAMRNKLAYDFANEIGSLGMRSEWVECVLNGEWQGLYQLCEHIRIDKNRVNVFNWEDEAEDRGIEGGDTDFGWIGEDEDISGGYLFESSSEYDAISQFWINSGRLGLAVMVNSPECLFTNTRIRDWCEGYFTGFCRAMTSLDGYSDEGLHYSEYGDVDSMAAYFLVMEMFGNDDAEKKSRYFYKDRGELVRFGPVWDFDWGVGNDVVDTTIFKPESWRVQNHDYSFFREWADDPWFCTRLRTLYWRTARAKFAALLGDGGTIARYREKLAAAGAANDGKWFRTRGFAADADRLRDFLTARLAWMDAQFADVPTLMASLRAAATDHPSTAPYEADAARLPIAFANAPGGRVRKGEDLRLSMSVGGAAARVGVYANGLKVGEPVEVSGGRIESVIPAAALTAGKDEDNCISLVAFASDGTVVARNFALMRVDRDGFMVILR